MTPDDVPEGPLIVDTDVASWLGWGRAGGDRFAPLVAGHVLALSFATVAELWFGAEKAGWSDRRRQTLDDIVRRYVIVPGTEQVARRFAVVKASFADQMSELDMWVAATALIQVPPFPVVTNNLRHFAPLSGRFGFELIHPDV